LKFRGRATQLGLLGSLEIQGMESQGMRTDTGTVKWFSDSKGIGFITPDSGGKDLFAHFSAIHGEGARKTLRVNQKVSFDVSNGPKGNYVANIRVLD
jgi:CspA family cold shock protein